MFALQGIRVLELAGLAPVPLVGQILADFGAKVIRVSKPTADFPDPLSRGKRSIVLDTSKPEGRALLRRLIGEPCVSSPVPFDVLLDPYRPGVLERLLTSKSAKEDGYVERIEDLLPSRLILARVSGYGHDMGHAYARAAGHDINYLAASGVLSMLRSANPDGGWAESSGSSAEGAAGFRGSSSAEGMGPLACAAASAAGRPIPPSNLLADFAGGSLLAVQGILMALLQRAMTPSGLEPRGQVVDASMTAGASYLGTLHWQLLRMAQADSAAGGGGARRQKSHSPPATAATSSAAASSSSASSSTSAAGTDTDSGLMFADSVVPFLQPGFAPYYDTYACLPEPEAKPEPYAYSEAPSPGRRSDSSHGRRSAFVAVGAIEGPFFVQLMRGLRTIVPWPADLGLGMRRAGRASPAADDADEAKAEAKALVRMQNDRSRWPALRSYLQHTFALRPRSFWCQPRASSASKAGGGADTSSVSGVTGVFAPDGQFGDACVSPVLLPGEAMHLQRFGRLPWAEPAADGAWGRRFNAETASAASDTFGAPLPAPRLSRTPDIFRGVVTLPSAQVGKPIASDYVRNSDRSTVASNAGKRADASQAITPAGAHTDLVLREMLALSNAELARLRADGVIA